MNELNSNRAAKKEVSKVLTRILFIILLIIGSAAIATAQTTALKRYYNKENKVGFRYPATWKLSTKDMRATDEGFTGLAEVSIPKTGKNVSAFATVSASKRTADKCKVGFDDSGVEKPKRVKMGALRFYKGEEVEGGMETVTPLEHYETFHNGVCYDVTLALPQAKYAKGINDKALFNQLYVVLRTFYFGK